MKILKHQGLKILNPFVTVARYQEIIRVVKLLNEQQTMPSKSNISIPDCGPNFVLPIIANSIKHSHIVYTM